MGIVLAQTTKAGPGAGKRNDYRVAPKPKAIAACVDWSGGSIETLRVGAWASSWLPPGTDGVPPLQDALKSCQRNNDKPGKCYCQVVDENDRNVLRLPPAIAGGTPGGYAGLARFDGSWTGRDATWQVTLTIKNGNIAGESVCLVGGAGRPRLAGTIDEAGDINANIDGPGMMPRSVTGTFPHLKVSAGGNCGGGEMTMVRGK